MTGTLISAALNACRSAISFLEDRKRSSAMRRDFWSLGLEDCTGIMKAVGLTPREFDDTMHRPFASEDLLSSATHSIGINLKDFGPQLGEQSGAMQRTCMTCSYRRQCRRDIENSDFASHYQDYCPNYGNFAHLIKVREQLRPTNLN